MRRLATLLLLILTLASPLVASAPKGVLAAPKGLFFTELPHEDKILVGTAWCRPDQTSPMLITASHAAGPNMAVRDWQGKTYPVKTVLKDEKRDVAILFLDSDEKVCELNPLTWAKQFPEIGDDLWLYGYGGAARPYLRKGILSSEPGTLESINHAYVLAQTNALHGDSGSPLFDSEGRVVGMMLGVGSDGDGNTIDYMIPLKELRKVVK